MARPAAPEGTAPGLSVMNAKEGIIYEDPFKTDKPLYDYSIEYDYSHLPENLKEIIHELEEFDKVGDWFSYDMKFPELDIDAKSYWRIGKITEYDYKTLLKKDYILEEISEKIRLLYVALTRAKEKMIIVTSLDSDKIYVTNNEKVIDDLDRMKYKSFKDILNSVYEYIEKYITNVNIPEINDDYKISKNINLDGLINTNETITVEEKEFQTSPLEEKHFSKETSKLITEEEKNNMNFGTEMHYMLENTNLKNPDYTLLSPIEKSILENLLKNDIFKNINNAEIYQEYEFIDDNETSEKTGVIDLMLEYNDHIDIIDYKLKNVADNAYKKQLNGYKEYIKNKTHKQVDTYLYSLLDRTLTKID